MCARCSCFSSSSKQRGQEIGFSICLLLLQHRTSSQWIDSTIPGGFCFFLADMEQLSETHPDVHAEFISENHSISRSTQPFAQVWTDMAIGRSIHLDSKTTSGITGIS